MQHVLGPFVPEEREVVNPVLSCAADSVIAWLGGTSVQTLMDRCNGPGSGGLEENL